MQAARTDGELMSDVLRNTSIASKHGYEGKGRRGETSCERSVTKGPTGISPQLREIWNFLLAPDAALH